MGLKPDTWIRKLALEEGMIDPFCDGQKRNGVISYGLSSYGYDIRIADEFMVFTPGVGNLTVVDPKNIDPHAMVEFTGEVCIIPPNSFALARSLEYMRMPRNVLGAVLGKSTYARCFRGDTRVALVDGSHPTLEEMATRAQEGELFWGYSVGPCGRIIVTLLEAPRYVGRDALLEIELDSGKRIHCTPDHQFLTRDGRMVAAEQLRADAALMPLYRKLVRGYEVVYQPLNGHLYPTHRLADEWNLRHDVYKDVPDTHRHHVDRNRLNITRIDAKVLTQQDNHRVVSVRALPGDHDVYCLTVPEAGNFALEAGVFVHNCGIVTNFTPLEPGWHGYITIEISNTTPLPAKIYANEGIAQVLFFEGDAPCEVSYADKKGKYQGQTGVVLPRL
ncbi:MAG: dCTP deaminase domain-containing protein [Anaerolineales bacterium]